MVPLSIPKDVDFSTAEQKSKQAILTRREKSLNYTHAYQQRNYDYGIKVKSNFFIKTNANGCVIISSIPEALLILTFNLQKLELSSAGRSIPRRFVGMFHLMNLTMVLMQVFYLNYRI